jgi:large subunit ribosomal protein L24
MKIRKWDKVIVKAWSSKWKTGQVLNVSSKTNKVLVEWVNLKTKYKKKTSWEKWSMIRREFPIDASNVMVVSPKTWEASRVWFKTDKTWKKVRVAKKDWEVL